MGAGPPGPAGDSAPRLRLKASGMAERFPFGFAAMNDNILYHALACPRASAIVSRYPPFNPRKQRVFRIGPPRGSRPGREAAKRTLDGEDRSDTIEGPRGKGGDFFQAFPQAINEDGVERPHGEPRREAHAISL